MYEASLELLPIVLGRQGLVTKTPIGKINRITSLSGQLRSHQVDGSLSDTWE